MSKDLHSQESIQAMVTPLKELPFYHKCCRCKQTTLSFNHDGLCDRCVCILVKHYPDHWSIPFILDNIKERGAKIEDNPYWGNY